MVQQISDAELEIMKIVWGNTEEVTLFPYIMEGLGQAVSEEYFDCAAVAADEQRFFERQENRTPQRIYRPCFRKGISDCADEKLPGQDLRGECKGPGLQSDYGRPVGR